MNIGIFFSARKLGGGGFQYAMTLMDALCGRTRDTVLIFNGSPDLPKKFFQHPNCQVIDAAPLLGVKNPAGRILDRYIHDGLLLTRQFTLLHLYDGLVRARLFKNTLKQKKVDIMVFPTPHVLAAQLPIPTIAPIHDLQHRLQPHFPELSEGRSRLNKEYLFSRIAAHASTIFVDSEIGKEDLQQVYGVSEKRITILPFLPPEYPHAKLEKERAKQTILPALPDRYLFYPAQFWPHKNHVNLVSALCLLKKQGTEIDLVLAGCNQDKWGIGRAIAGLAANSGISHRIHVLGFVADEDMPELYRHAAALVMPTSFGPTNIPILEAWSLECPVIYSNIRGCREQAGDAALLVDPLNPQDIAEKISTLLQDPELRRRLIDRGKIRLGKWTKQQFIDKINQQIDAYDRHSGN